MLTQNNIPTLLLTKADVPYPPDSIYVRNDIGICMAAEHLIQLDHEKISYIGECLSDIRYRSFCNSIKQNAIPYPAFVKRGSERFEKGGYLRTLELLREKELPTALIVCYDQFAFGAMRAFQENGIRIPEDISVIGYDNTVMDMYYPVWICTILSN